MINKQIKKLTHPLNEDLRNIIIMDNMECDGMCDRTFKTIYDDQEDLYFYANPNIEDSYGLILCTTCLVNNALLNEHNEKLAKYKIKKDTICDLCSNTFNNNGYELQTEQFLYICSTCYNTKDICKRYFKKLDNPQHTYVCMRNDGWRRIVYQLKPITNLTIPKMLHKYPELHITEEKISIMENYLDVIVNLDPRIKNVCSNLAYWIPFILSDEMPFYHSYTFLLIYAGCGSNHPVVSGVWDDHGRVSLDLVYDDFDTFIDDYEQWKNNPCSNKEQIEAELKQLKWIEDEHNEKIAMLCTDFSNYIRLMRHLGLHYG